ncbi:BnaC04g27150D [Brassica napus]|uniref:BnaC04g27150D protein n=1 Tax=Brassica napus TaxID=3708 RepID=A0A078GWJ5_BRANA|nr:BnaC04g27150D [Brassica napus]
MGRGETSWQQFTDAQNSILWISL